MPERDKKSSHPPISCNVNFEAKFLEENRRYLICLSPFCPNFSLDRNKNDMSVLSHVSSHSPHRYLGNNHYSFFKNFRSLGGVFPFILMGTFSSLALLLLQPVYLKNVCVLLESEWVTSLLEWRAPGQTGERILFSWIWIPHLLLYIDNIYIEM